MISHKVVAKTNFSLWQAECQLWVEMLKLCLIYPCPNIYKARAAGSGQGEWKCVSEGDRVLSMEINVEAAQERTFPSETLCLPSAELWELSALWFEWLAEPLQLPRTTESLGVYALFLQDVSSFYDASYLSSILHKVLGLVFSHFLTCK